MAQGGSPFRKIFGKGGRRNSFLFFEAMDAIGEEDQLAISFAESLPGRLISTKTSGKGIVLKWW